MFYWFRLFHRQKEKNYDADVKRWLSTLDLGSHINAAPGTPLWQLARVAKAEHRIEECLQRSKSEAGLADYEVRHWTGWHHHQTLLLDIIGFNQSRASSAHRMRETDDDNSRGDYAAACNLHHEIRDAFGGQT